MTDATSPGGAPAASTGRAPGVWSVTYKTAAGQEQKLELEEATLYQKGVRLGRNPKTNDIVLTDFSISREHCVLTCDQDGRLLVRDLGSTNGTFVNQQRIAPNEAVHVGSEDDVEVGNLEFHFEYTPGVGDATVIMPQAKSVQAKPAEPVQSPPAAQPDAQPDAKPADAKAEPGKTPAPARRQAAGEGSRAASTGGGVWALRLLFGAAIVAGVFAIGFAEQLNIEAANGYRFIGAAVVAAVLLQMTFALWSSMQRTAAERAWFNQSLVVLRSNVEAASAHMRQERDRATLTWNGLRKFRIDRKVQEGGGICSFYLKPHDNKAFPPFEPGQYLTFNLRIPGKDKPVIRCYSLSDSPLERDYYRVSIKKLPPPRDKPDAPPGLSSCFFHDQLEEGDIVDCKTPGGKFYMDQSKHTPVVLIGGGVGLTPVLSMVNTIALSGSKRETHFFYGVRNRSEHVMKEHLEALARDNENIYLHVCYSDPTEDDVEGRDYQHAERVSVDLFKRVLPSNNYDFYICGPPPMMESLVRDLDEWGVPDASVHFEAFGPASVKKAHPKPAGDAAPAEAAKTFEIKFAKSGKSLTWDGSFDSLLEFAESNGVAIDSGCRAGNCGTCITALRDGAVKYVEEPGAQPEDGSCLVCISVPNSNMTLEA